MALRNLLLGEQVPVGAAMLHGDAVTFTAHAVARHSDSAVIVCQGGILQNCHVPQEGVRVLLSLQTQEEHVYVEILEIARMSGDVLLESDEQKESLQTGNHPC